MQLVFVHDMGSKPKYYFFPLLYLLQTSNDPCILLADSLQPFPCVRQTLCAVRALFNLKTLYCSTEKEPLQSAVRLSDAARDARWASHTGYVPANLRSYSAFCIHASPAAHQARCYFNTFHNKKSKMFSSINSILAGKKFSLHAKSVWVMRGSVFSTMSQLLFLILTLKGHILHWAVCCEGTFVSCSLFPTTSDLDFIFFSPVFSQYISKWDILGLCWTLLFSLTVSSCFWDTKASAHKCERVNLKASSRQSCKKKREARELEGFIISVQCFLSPFHHPVWRGILSPHSPWVSERPHTNCACEYAQSSPHGRAQTCARSYRCWQRS